MAGPRPEARDRLGPACTDVAVAPGSANTIQRVGKAVTAPAIDIQPRNPFVVVEPMTQRRALALINGQASEIPATDQILSDGGAAIGTSSNRQMTVAGNGTAQFRYDDNSLNFPVNLANTGMTAAGQGVGVQWTLGTSQANAVPAARLSATALGTFADASTRATRLTFSALNATGSLATLGTWDDANGLVFNVKSPTVAAPAIRIISNVLFQRHDIRDYAGIDLTGTNDCASIVQKAANYSSTDPSIGTGDPLYVPPGKITLGSPVNVWHGVQIQGSGRAQTHYNRNNRGTTFLITHSGAGFASTTPSSPEWTGPANYNQFFRAHIRDISTERLQPDPHASGTWSPDTSLGYDFDLKGCTTLSRVHLTNPTRGIRIYDGGQSHLYDISGSPFLIGVDVDRCTETCYFDKIEFWPWWYRDCSNDERYRIMVWCLNNLTAFTIGRMDATFWSNIFSIWCQNSLVLRQTSSTEAALQGSMSGIVTSMNMDGCVYGMVAQANDANVTFNSVGCAAWNQINLRFFTDMYGSADGNRLWNSIGQRGSDVAASHLIRVEGNGNNFHFDNVSGAWSRYAVIGVNGKQNNVVVGRAQGQFWNQYSSPDNQVQYNGDYTGPYGIVHNNDPSNYVSVDNAYAPNESAKGPLLSGSIYVPPKVLIPQSGNSSSAGRQTTQVSDGRSHTFTT